MESRINKTEMLTIKSKADALMLVRVIAFAFRPALKLNKQLSHNPSEMIGVES